MKTFSIIALLLALLVAGCKHPNEVEIFAGMLLANHVAFDGGARWGKQTAAYSFALITDRSRPLRASGRVFGFYGLRLMQNLLTPLRINGLAMLERVHRIRVGQQHFGFGHEYVRDLGSIYQPDLLFTWTATPDSLGPVEVSVRAPAGLEVASPEGGSLISRTRDLKLLWTGEGEMTIILSAYNPLAKKARPLLRMHPLANRGRARISSAILKALPADNFYVFTFIVANRTEARVSQGSDPIPVLAQAASVYNVYVEIQ
jgi:hypothetical protein